MAVKTFRFSAPRPLPGSTSGLAAPSAAPPPTLLRRVLLSLSRALPRRPSRSSAARAAKPSDGSSAPQALGNSAFGSSPSSGSLASVDPSFAREVQFLSQVAHPNSARPRDAHHPRRTPTPPRLRGAGRPLPPLTPPPTLHPLLLPLCLVLAVYAVTLEPFFSIIMELGSAGSLSDLLSRTDLSSFNWLQRVQTGAGVASGVECARPSVRVRRGD